MLAKLDEAKALLEEKEEALKVNVTSPFASYAHPPPSPLPQLFFPARSLFTSSSVFGCLILYLYVMRGRLVNLRTCQCGRGERSDIDGIAFSVLLCFFSLVSPSA